MRLRSGPRARRGRPGAGPRGRELWRRLRLSRSRPGRLRPHRPRREGRAGAARPSTPTSSPSAASIARARRCSSRRSCATPRAPPIAGLPLTLVARRPDGVEYRRALVEDQGLGGRAFSLPLLAGRHARHLARRGLYRPEGRGGRRGELPGRGLRARAARDRRLTPKTPALRPGQPAEIDVAARYLYGAPGAEPRGLRRGRGRGGGRRRASRASTASPSASRTRRSRPRPPRSRRAARPTRKAASPCRCRSPELAAAAADARRGSPCASASRAAARSSAASRCRSCRKGPVVGVRKNFGGDLAEGATATFDVVLAVPGRHAPGAAGAWPGASTRSSAATSGSTSDGPLGLRAREVDAPGRGRTHRPRRRCAGAHRRAGGVGRVPARCARAPGLETAQTSVSFTVGWSGDQTADSPDLLDMTLDKASYRRRRDDRGAPRPALRRQGDARRRQRQGARHPRRRRGGGRHQRRPCP